MVASGSSARSCGLTLRTAITSACGSPGWWCQPSPMMRPPCTMQAPTIGLGRAVASPFRASCRARRIHVSCVALFISIWAMAARACGHRGWLWEYGGISAFCGRMKGFFRKIRRFCHGIKRFCREFWGICGIFPGICDVAFRKSASPGCRSPTLPRRCAAECGENANFAAWNMLWIPFTAA